MVARVEEKLPSRDVRVNSPHMVIIGKRMKVHSSFDRVQFVKKICSVLKYKKLSLTLKLKTKDHKPYAK